MSQFDDDKFWELKVKKMKDYVEISVPAIEDVIRFPGLFGSTKEEEKLRKRQQYEHMLHSPIPKAAMKLQRWGKLTDDIEDYASTAAGAGYFAMKAAKRWSPFLARKIGTRAVPFVGWFMLGLDVLNLGTALFTLSSNPMGAKRAIHSAKDLTNKRALTRLVSADRVKRWKPSIGTLLEALQASEDATGYGIRLGPVMGAIGEEFWGIEKFLAGDTRAIRASYPWQRPGTLEQKAYKSLGSSGEIIPFLYHSGSPLYFPAVIAIGMAARMITKHSAHPEWDNVYFNTKHIPLYYNPPTNPITREVLSDMGFDPDERVGYLGIDGPQMPTLEQLGFTYDGSYSKDIETSLENLSHSWRSYFYNCELGDMTDSFLSLLSYPDDQLQYIPVGPLDMLARAANKSIIPPLNTPPQRIQLFCNILSDLIVGRHGGWPPKQDIEAIAISCWGDFDTFCPPTKTYTP